MSRKSNSSEERLDFRIQNVLADSPEGVMLKYIRSGMYQGTPVSPRQLALSMLGMCLMPLAYKAAGKLSDKELQQNALANIQLLLLHIKLLCAESGLDWQTLVSSCWVTGVGVTQATGGGQSPVAVKPKQVDVEPPDIPVKSEMDFAALDFDS